MNRKTILAIAALGIAGRGAAATDRPNILFCIADDQSFPHASAYGCTWVKTPAFDRVAREGLLFDRAYTPNAKCSPSRACILTGRNSWQLESAADHNGWYPAGYRSFMEALGANGYATGFTGKGWGPGNPGEINGRPRQLAGPAFSRLRAKPPTDGISPIDYAANFEDFLKRKPAGKPFCFWYGGHEPHRRYQAGSGVKLGGKTLEQIPRVPSFWPDNDTIRNDLLDYAFEVEWFDQHLGRMLRALEVAGELEHTIVIVTSDNGMPFPRSKGAPYEVSLHMPLAMRWGDGLKNPGRRVAGYVSFIDFAPTFLELAGLTADSAGMAPIQGHSLAPILRGEADGAERIYVGQERHDVGRPDDAGYPVRGVLTGDLLYLRNFEPGRWPMCDPITGYMNTDSSPTKSLILAENRLGVNHWRWELNFGHRPAEEMYNLRTDPDCLTNLAADPAFAARREKLSGELLAELKAQHDPRMEGNGAVFDRYPNATPNHDFYRRFVIEHEKFPPGGFLESDFEKPDFDPERPMAAKK